MTKEREGCKQLNFWIEDDVLEETDKFWKEKGFHTRTKYLLKSLDITQKNPELLEDGFLTKLQSDRDLLKQLIKLFDNIPCEFNFDGRPHEINRIMEIRKELEL